MQHGKYLVMVITVVVMMMVVMKVMVHATWTTFGDGDFSSSDNDGGWYTIHSMVMTMLMVVMVLSTSFTCVDFPFKPSVIFLRCCSIFSITFVISFVCASSSIKPDKIEIKPHISFARSPLFT